MKLSLRPKFRIRTMLVVVAILAVPLSYIASQKRWAMERQAFRLKHRGMEYTWLDMDDEEPPGILGWFGSRTSDAWLTTMGEETLAEALRLFPEAEPCTNGYDEEKFCVNPFCKRDVRIPVDADEAGKQRLHCNKCIQAGFKPPIAWRVAESLLAGVLVAGIPAFVLWVAIRRPGIP